MVIISQIEYKMSICHTLKYKKKTQKMLIIQLFLAQSLKAFEDIKICIVYSVQSINL